MPVRIYDISKKLGLENKQVLTKAKELGIAAKVASSSLDKITAEYLEQQLIQAYPHTAPASPATESTTGPEPAAVAPAPPPQTEVSLEPHAELGATTAVLEPPPPPAAEAPAPPQSVS